MSFVARSLAIGRQKLIASKTGHLITFLLLNTHKLFEDVVGGVTHPPPPRPLSVLMLSFLPPPSPFPILYEQGGEEAGIATDRGHPDILK